MCRITAKKRILTGFTLLMLPFSYTPLVASEDTEQNIDVRYIPFLHGTYAPVTIGNIEEQATCHKSMVTSNPISERITNIIGPSTIKDLKQSNGVLFDGYQVRAKIDFPTGETIYIDNKGTSLFYGNLKQGLYYSVTLEKQDFLKMGLYLEMLCDIRPISPSINDSDTENDFNEIFTGTKQNYLKLPTITLREN